MAQARRSNGERLSPVEDWWRLVVKAQRGRIATRLAASDRRMERARTDAMEDWDGVRTGGKKPSLDYYDARRW